MKKLFLVLFLVSLIVPVFAQTRTPFPLPDSVKTAWQKPTKFEVVKPNVLKVRGSGGLDMDAIYLRDIPYKGEKYLVIKVAAMEGKFPWDKGKMFGVTLGNPSSQRGFLTPEGDRKVLDRMVDGPFAVGDEVKFPLTTADPKKTGMITVGMTIFCSAGSNYDLELWFEN